MMAKRGEFSRWLGALALVFPLLYILSSAFAQNDADRRPIYVSTIKDDAVTPVTEKYLVRGIEKAERERAQCVIIEFDTPGGLVSSTEAIVQKFLDTPVPVVVFVYPPGGKAWSAGCIITLAAHIAVMAPQTSIGSAHPVALGGGEQSKALEDKATNAVVSIAKNAAERRERNIAWAEAAVRESKNATAKEALEANVIDLLAEDLDDLLKKIDNREVKTRGNTVVTLHTANARTERLGMSTAEKFFRILANPQLAYIMLTLGIMGLIYEFANPGAIFPGVTGGICLILFLFATRVLPVNYAAVAFIALGIGLFLADIKIPSHGMLSAGGAVAFLMGSLMLIDASEMGPVDWNSPEVRRLVQIPLLLILAVSGTTTAFFMYCVQAGLRAQRRRVTTGPEGLVGIRGVAKTELNPRGTIVADGAYWTAQSESGLIEEGAEVIVTAVDRMLLTVRAIKQPERKEE